MHDALATALSSIYNFDGVVKRLIEWQRALFATDPPASRLRGMHDRDRNGAIKPRVARFVNRPCRPGRAASGFSYGPSRDPADSDMLFRGWRRAFQLFRPVEDDVDLLERSSRRVLDHQESPAVR